MLPSRIKPLIRTPHSSTTSAPTSYYNDNDDPEDLLTSFLPHLFPNEASACLGDPGKSLLYASSEFSDLRVLVPDYGENRDAAKKHKIEEGDEEKSCSESGSGFGSTGPINQEEGRRLMAHYLWGGALIVADEVEKRVKGKRKRVGDDNCNNIDIDSPDDSLWSVEGENVLEVGAG